MAENILAWFKALIFGDEAKQPVWFSELAKLGILSDPDIDFVKNSFREAAICWKDLSVKLDRPLSEPNLTVEQFYTIKESLVCVKAAREKFFRIYPRWRQIRLGSIAVVRRVGNTLCEDKRNCDIARVVGGGVSLLGGILGIAGAITTVSDRKTGSSLGKIGSALVGLGTVTAVGTSVTESVRKGIFFREANGQLEGEKSLYQEMISLFDCYEELLERFRKILQFTDKRAVILLLQSVKKIASSTLSASQSPLHQVVTNCARNLMPSSSAPEMISLLLTSAVFCRGNNLSLDIFSSMTKLYGTQNGLKEIVCFDLKPLVDGFGLMLTGAESSRAVVHQAVCHGLLASVSTALDTIRVIQSSIEIHNGSKCKEGEKMIDLANYLKRELDEFEEVHSEMRQKGK